MINRNDHAAAARALAAIAREMTPGGATPHRETDTLFLGAWEVTEAGRAALDAFGVANDYKLVLATFAGDASDGPTGFEVFVNDGIGKSAVLRNGRLWKRDARSASVLLFDDVGLTIRLGAKGRMIVRRTSGDRHELGHRLAAAAVRTRAARSPAVVPVISSIGPVPVVSELRAVANMFAMAA